MEDWAKQLVLVIIFLVGSWRACNLVRQLILIMVTERRLKAESAFHLTLNAAKTYAQSLRDLSTALGFHQELDATNSAMKSALETSDTMIQGLIGYVEHLNLIVATKEAVIQNLRKQT